MRKTITSKSRHRTPRLRPRPTGAHTLLLSNRYCDTMYQVSYSNYLVFVFVEVSVAKNSSRNHIGRLCSPLERPKH